MDGVAKGKLTFSGFTSVKEIWTSIYIVATDQMDSYLCFYVDFTTYLDIFYVEYFAVVSKSIDISA